jgi:hypothetical protein
MLGHVNLMITELYMRVSINLLRQVYSATHLAHLKRPEPPATTARDPEAEAELFDARGDTGKSRIVASFLLAWWNAAECSGFELADVWAVDTAIAVDMVGSLRSRPDASTTRTPSPTASDSKDRAGRAASPS